MTLIKYRPTREVTRGVPSLLGSWDPFDRLLDDVTSWPWMARQNRAETAIFSPPVDIYQTQEEIVAKAELPGIKPEDVELTIHGDTVTIKGSKKFEAESGEGKYQYVERSYGEFLRTFTLPSSVDESKVKADFKDGVLEVHMPIAEEAKPRKISITNGK